MFETNLVKPRLRNMMWESGRLSTLDSGRASESRYASDSCSTVLVSIQFYVSSVWLGLHLPFCVLVELADRRRLPRNTWSHARSDRYRDDRDRRVGTGVTHVTLLSIILC